MLVYTFKRLLASIPTLLAASILVFLFIHLIPGDPAAILLGDTATPEEIAALTREMAWMSPFGSNMVSGWEMCFEAILEHPSFFVSRCYR